MGNSDIRDIASITKIRREELKNKVLAVDAPNWIYRYMTITSQFTDSNSYTSDRGEEYPNLIAVPKGLKKFFKYDITPIMVFDGDYHDLKREEVTRRKEKRKKAAKKAQKTDNVIEAAKQRARAQNLNQLVIDSTKELLDILDIPYCTAPLAAEAQTAHMTKSEEIYGALSEDYDSILFGAKNTIRKFTTSDNMIEKMILSDTLDKNNISREQLILAAIMCGTDYNSGVSGIGPKTSIDIVKDINSVSQLEQKEDINLDKGREIFDLFVNPPTTGNWDYSQKIRPDIQKAKEYIKSKSIEIDNIEKTLEEIDEEANQTGIGDFS